MQCTNCSDNSMTQTQCFILVFSLELETVKGCRIRAGLCYHYLWLRRTRKEIWACACTLLPCSLSHSYELWVSFITLASSRLIRWESGPAPSDKCPNQEKCTGVSVTESSGRRVDFVLHPVLTELYIQIMWKCPLILSKLLIWMRLHPIVCCIVRRTTCINKCVSFWLPGKLEAEEF